MSASNTSPQPRLSVGVPVYNGERYIARTLESLLNQTYRDFELIICDNGSTDRTADICCEFAARDSRIQFHRADRNLGVVRNFNRCVELARGELFHWHAADDMAEPTLLEKCVAVLDADQSVVLAFARTMLIDENDRRTVPRDYDAQADDPRAHARFSNLINLDHHKHCAQEVYGVVRRAALLRTPLYEPIVRTDSILLARLALLGRFRAVEEPLFLNREHEQRSVRLVPGGRATTRSRLSRWVGLGPIPPAEFWDPSKAGKIVFPEWRILGEYLRSIQLAPNTFSERAMCHLTWLSFAFGHAPKLVRDVVIAIEHAILGHPGAPRGRGFEAEEKVTPA
ncbi:MAG: glycosyltransferase family 2 protein [Anaerolineae bacterium]|nr:glycosyltransferase family 2 protein [Phycisphaerae bacterium]